MLGGRLVCLALTALSCSGTDLEHRIDALVESSPAAARGFVGVHAVQLSTGKVLYKRNHDKLLLPASNMKLFTSALALLRLGPEYKYTTQLTIDPSGDLVLRGSGDPSMSAREFPYDAGGKTHAPLQAIEELAEQAVKGGLQRVDGDIVGDDRLYPWAPYSPSWTQDDALRDYGAPVTALTLNENTLTIAVHPGKHSGDSVEVRVEPAVEYYSIDNRLITVGAKSEPHLRASRLPGSRQLELWGSLPAGHETIRETIAVDDPALFAAQALYDALIRRGVAIFGRPVAKHRTAFDDDAAPQRDAIASRTSPPMTQLLQVMDKVSQNLFAELVLREVGRTKRHSGTREAALDELQSLVAEIGGPEDDARFEDGSGLARNSMVTPRLLTRLLVHMHASKFREDWLSLFPIGGEDGTLKKRFKDSEAKSIRAKTGSLSRGIALSGYAESKTYGRVAFSIIVNDFSTPAGDTRTLIDKIAMSLLE